MSSKIGIIDIFAGPGGLGEGFSSFALPNGKKPFEIAVSAEMETSAHSTLRLRSFLRKLREREGPWPRAYRSFVALTAAGATPDPSVHFHAAGLGELWRAADEEALNLTLGDASHDRELHARIAKLKSRYDELILIGGPPCQAYSLVGRARQKNVPGFTTTGDQKHFLYLEYLRIVAKFKPALFIMENVKGILTSTVGGNVMFDQIRKDLANPSATIGGRRTGEQEYVLLPIHVPEGELRDVDAVARDPSLFTIRAESHGLPQARHRVIIMGVRKDLADAAIAVAGLDELAPVSISSALSGLPRLRSGLSRTTDSGEAWAQEMTSNRDSLVRSLKKSHAEVAELLRDVVFSARLERSSTQYGEGRSAYSRSIRAGAELVCNHASRPHMSPDLARYLFVAAFGARHLRSPKSDEFPSLLAPAHANWSSGAFADRFRVQAKRRPSHTITSHLSKDGHAFIHWDLRQCRSLTVREAARLQTFPDDYMFLGNRTQQFVQVGNAVPPRLADQIARVVWSVLRSA